MEPNAPPDIGTSANSDSVIPLLNISTHPVMCQENTTVD